MKVFAVKRGARCFLIREREVRAVSDAIDSVPRSQASIAKTLMLESRAKEFKVFTEDELVVDPTQRQRDGPALYKWMSGAFYGFKRNEHVVFFNAGDVEAVDARET